MEWEHNAFANNLEWLFDQSNHVSYSWISCPGAHFLGLLWHAGSLQDSWSGDGTSANR